MKQSGPAVGPDPTDQRVCGKVSVCGPVLPLASLGMATRSTTFTTGHRADVRRYAQFVVAHTAVMIAYRHALIAHTAYTQLHSFAQNRRRREVVLPSQIRASTAVVALSLPSMKCRNRECRSQL